MTRAGGGLVKGLVALLLIGGLVALSLGVAANWKRAGGFSLQVFDPAWWTASSEAATPVIDRTKAAMGHAYTAIWGPGGLVERAQTWISHWRSEHASSAPATAGNVNQGTGSASTGDRHPQFATRAIELRLDDAEADFQDGVNHYQAAHKAHSGSPEAADELVRARACFLRVQDILAQSLPAYQGRPDHDPTVLQQATRLADLDHDFIQRTQGAGGL